VAVGILAPERFWPQGGSRSYISRFYEVDDFAGDLAGSQDRLQDWHLRTVTILNSRKFLVDASINSISVSPNSFVTVKRYVVASERVLTSSR
jgi:hypothetical protein